MGFDLFKTISDGIGTAINAAGSAVNDGWNALTSAGDTVVKTVNDGWNAATSFVNDGWNAAGSAVNDGWNAVTSAAGSAAKTVTDFAGGVYDAGSGIVKDISAVVGGAGNTLSTLKKYWYVPVIIGGVIVGYALVKKSPAGMTAGAIKALMQEY